MLPSQQFVSRADLPPTGVDSKAALTMRWLRRLFARLRGSRPTAPLAPVSAPEPETTKAEPQIWMYHVTVVLRGGAAETSRYPSERPVSVDDAIDLGAGRLVTVLEIVKEAWPGVRDGEIRARPTLPPPSSIH